MPWAYFEKTDTEVVLFVVAEVFFDLSDVVFGIGVAAPEGIGAVAEEEGLEFELHGIAHAFGKHEIDKAFGDPDLACGLEAEDIFAKSGEKVLGGGFGFCAVLEVENVFADGKVRGKRRGSGGELKKVDTIARGKIAEGFEDVSVVHF